MHKSKEVWKRLGLSGASGFKPLRNLLSWPTNINSYLLYTVVFIGGAIATFLLALAIAPRSRYYFEHHNAPPQAGAAAAPPRRRLIFSRQGGPVEEEKAMRPPLFCFYDRYSERQKEPVKYQLLKHLPVRYCSHLVYGYLSPSDLSNGSSGGQGTTESSAGSLSKAQRRIKQMVSLKASYPGLRVMVAIGGMHVDSRAFSDEMLTEGRREHFSQRAARWLRVHGLDGLHVHWLYPGRGNGRPSDRQNLPRFLAQLRRGFGGRKKGGGLLLTLFVPHNDDLIDRGYEVKAATKQVDYIVLEGWGYTEANRAEVTSPLFNRPPESNGSPANSVHELVALLADRGAPKSKMILGVSARGIGYTLARPEPSTVRAALRANQPGRPGPFTKTPGELAYFEVCYNVYRHNWARVFDAVTACPYAFFGTEWVTYDDADSLRAKSAFVRNQTLGGTALFDVACDDYIGLCGPRNILARSLHLGMRSYASQQPRKRTARASRVRGGAKHSRRRLLARWQSRS